MIIAHTLFPKKSQVSQKKKGLRHKYFSRKNSVIKNMFCHIGYKILSIKSRTSFSSAKYKRIPQYNALIKHQT